MSVPDDKPPKHSWTPADVFGTVASVALMTALFVLAGLIIFADGHVEFCRIQAENTDCDCTGTASKLNRSSIRWSREYTVIGVRSWRGDVTLYRSESFDDAREKAETICKLWKK